jgi:hypothetical protein
VDLGPVAPPRLLMLAGSQREHACESTRG